MEKFKILVDVLSSIASLIAIVTVLGAWISSQKKALKVKRVVVHQNEQTSNYILEIENSKPYPVELKCTRCFTKKHYKVEQVNNCFPTIHSAYSLTDSPFIANEKHFIEANGLTDIRFLECAHLSQVKELIFLFDTSHGYHSLKCKNITIVKMGTQTFGMEAMNEYSSRWAAIKNYTSLVIRRLKTIAKQKLTKRSS